MTEEGATVAAVMAGSLVAAGVTRVFAYPGDPIIGFMEELRRHEVDVVLARREGTAAFMAEADGLLGGVPGVCLSTLGPGSTALVNGVAAANLDKSPMIAISGQIESTREPFFTHQVVDHGALYTPITKWAGRIEAGSVGTTMRKAVRTATSERPGAVHLSVSGDTFAATTRDTTTTPPPSGVPSGGFATVGESPELVLRRARRPVLLAGTGAVRGGAEAAVARFAETVGAPIVVAPMAKGIADETGPYFAGVLDMACNQLVWKLLDDADLIVAAGFDPVELIKPWRIATPVLHLDSVPNTDQIYASSSEMIGDISVALETLAEAWTGEPAWAETEVAAFRRILVDAYYAGRVAGRLNPTDVVDVVRATMPATTLATTDVGSHKLLVGQGWTTTVPRSVLMTNGLSAMGFGVPAAIAAKSRFRDRPVVAMVGDGGFAMVATEMRLAAALGLGLVVVVFVDGSLNRIEIKQTVQGLPSVATRIEDTDLVKLADAMGCDGIRVESRQQLEAALGAVSGLSRPLVVEAHIDPEQYLAQY